MTSHSPAGSELPYRRPSILGKRRERRCRWQEWGEEVEGRRLFVCFLEHPVKNLSDCSQCPILWQATLLLPVPSCTASNSQTHHLALNGKQAVREASKRSNSAHTFQGDLCFQGPLLVPCGPRTGFLLGASKLQSSESISAGRRDQAGLCQYETSTKNWKSSGF